MRTFLTVVLTIQVATFVVIGSAYLARGEWRLGFAQLLLAVVQGVIYSGGIK